MELKGESTRRLSGRSRRIGQALALSAVITLAAKGGLCQQQTKATIQTPPPGSTLSGASVTFTWAPVERGYQYELDVGTGVGGNDIAAKFVSQTGTVTVSGLPTDGSTVYVRLVTSFNGVSAYNDYGYTAYTNVPVSLSKASIVTPAPGSTLGGASATFTWAPVERGYQYELDVGTGVGGNDIAAKFVSQTGTVTVSGLPTDGSTVYVRLVTSFNGSSGYNDYAYTAASGALQPPTVDVRFSVQSSPINRSIFMYFSVNNPNLSANLAGINFVDSLPAGMQIVRPSGLTGQCPGGTITATGGDAAISVSGVTLPANTSCVFALNVASSTAGTKTNTVTISAAGTGSSTTNTPITFTDPTGNTPPPPPGGGGVAPGAVVGGVGVGGGPGSGSGGSGAGSGGMGSGGGSGGGGADSSGCNCGDLPSLRHRLEEVTALRAGWQAKIQTTSATDVATRDTWFHLLNELRGTLPQLNYTNPATPMNVGLFNSYVDPLCNGRAVSADACFDGATAAHQAAHAASCRIGHWNGQRAWTTREMIQEEINANQAEMDFLQGEIGVLACSCVAPFALLVQNGTVSNIQMPGIITGGSSRSLNNGQGILIPITLHADGTFEGSGSGRDSGEASGVSSAARGYVNSQFGQSISIQASGIITPGQCNDQSCGPDVMHLVLSGGTGPQTANAQGRFPGVSINRSEVTQGGSGAVQFTLPAYIGQSAEQTLLDMGMLKSTMSVAIVAPSGTGAGGAALIPPQQCSQPQNRPPQLVTTGGGAGGGATGGGAGGGAGSGGSGTVNNAPRPAIVAVNERIGVADAQVLPVSLQVGEGIHVNDAVAGPLSIAVVEGIHASDLISSTTAAFLGVSELIRVDDNSSVVVPAPSVKATEQVHITEAITVVPRMQVKVAEQVHVLDTVNTVPRTTVRVTELVHVVDAGSVR